MKKLLKVLSFVLVLSALAGGLILIRNRQELRRGATNPPIKAWFLPTELINKKAGDTIPVSLLATLGENELNGFEITITYTPSVLEITDSDIVLNSAFPKDNIGWLEIDNTKGTIKLSAFSISGVKGSLLANEPLLKLNFKAKANGQATIEVTSDDFVGFDSGGNVVSFDLKNDKGEEGIKVVYQIGDSSTMPKSCDQACIDQGYASGYCDSAPVYYQSPPPCETGEVNIGTTGDCTADIEGATKACCCLSGSNILTPTATPTATLVPTRRPTSTPTQTPTPVPTRAPSGETPILNFKVSFTGVNSAQRANVKPKVLIRVKNLAGNVVEFANVELTPGTGNVFDGSVALTGVNAGSKYTVFIKGPKHLAKRFCKDGQEAKCVGSGNITLFAGENDFDFSKDSLEPGDLPNPNSAMAQDGVVNSIDLSLLNTNRCDNFSKSCGQQNLNVADVDFNGVVSGQDMVLLLQTLSTRYDEEI